MDKIIFIPRSSQDPHGIITNEHRDILGIVANTMITNGYREVRLGNTCPINGFVATDYEWDSIGVLGGYCFTAFIALDSLPVQEMARVEFLVMRITNKKTAKSWLNPKALMAMMLTDPSVN